MTMTPARRSLPLSARQGPQVKPENSLSNGSIHGEGKHTISTGLGPTPAPTVEVESDSTPPCGVCALLMLVVSPIWIDVGKASGCHLARTYATARWAIAGTSLTGH